MPARLSAATEFSLARCFLADTVVQACSGGDQLRKIVVDSGYGVDSVHDRPPINHEARINHAKAETTALVSEGWIVNRTISTALHQGSLV